MDYTLPKMICQYWTSHPASHYYTSHTPSATKSPWRVFFKQLHILFQFLRYPPRSFLIAYQHSISPACIGCGTSGCGSGHGGDRLRVGLDDLRGLFQPSWFYDSWLLSHYCHPSSPVLQLGPAAAGAVSERFLCSLQLFCIHRTCGIEAVFASKGLTIKKKILMNWAVQQPEEGAIINHIVQWENYSKEAKWFFLRQWQQCDNVIS